MFNLTFLGSLKIPTGTEMAIGIFTLHRNKSVWGPNADIFDPDNFLPESVAKRSAYSFIPFSGGVRICIGNSALLRA